MRPSPIPSWEIPKKPKTSYAEAAERAWFRLVSVRHKSRPEDVARQSADVINVSSLLLYGVLYRVT